MLWLRSYGWRRTRAVCFLALPLCIACSQASAPEDPLFDVGGIVTAPGGPVADVLLSLTAGSSIGCSEPPPFTGRSDAFGRFAFQATNPCRSIWLLEATHPGYYQLPPWGEAIGFNTSLTGLVVTVEPFGPLTITTASLPTATVNTSYAATLEHTGNPATGEWSVVSGSLPAGITFDDCCTLGGSPTMAGTWDFTVRVQTDFESLVESAEAPLSITVTP